jgi:Tat protein translocase TatB subunit
MFGVSFGEIVIIFVVGLLVFGPERLPEIARSLGRLMNQLRRWSDEFKNEAYREFYAPSRQMKDCIDNISAQSKKILLDSGLPAGATVREHSPEESSSEIESDQSAKKSAHGTED